MRGVQTVIAARGLVALVLVGAAVTASAPPAAAQTPGVPPQPIMGTAEGGEEPEFIGSPAVPRPVEAPKVPQHPFMAPNERSNIHNDAFQSDTDTIAGPLGNDPEVTSTLFARECGSVAFDSDGRIVTVCVGLDRPVLAILDPVTLETIAAMPLPPRRADGGNPFTDFSGGGYFYLDHKDRAVLPTTEGHLYTVAVRGDSLELVSDVDLTELLVGRVVGDQFAVELVDFDVAGRRRAVVEPRVDVEAHVHHVDLCLGGVGEGGDGGSEEEVARVLPGPEVHEGGLRRHPGDPDGVDGRRNRAGDMGAVTVVVDVRGVDAIGVLAQPVDVGHVAGEVAAQLVGEVRGDVGVGAVDAGVDDADEHAVTTLLERRAAVGVLGADHLHVPLVAGDSEHGRLGRTREQFDIADDLGAGGDRGLHRGLGDADAGADAHELRLAKPGGIERAGADRQLGVCLLHGVELRRRRARVGDAHVVALRHEIAHAAQAREPQTHDQCRFASRIWHARGGWHQRIFRVARPIRTRISDMIQKRTITRGSGQPFSSKW